MHYRKKVKKMSRSDGKVTIDIIVNGKQVTKEIDMVEQGFSRLGKNADDVMKKVGSDMGTNTESGAKSANKAVDSVEKTVSDLGKTTESATSKAGKSIGDNFDSGSKGANQATDSVAKTVSDLASSVESSAPLMGRSISETFLTAAKDSEASTYKISNATGEMSGAVEAHATRASNSIAKGFESGAKDASNSTDGITKSVSNMVGSVEITMPGLGGAISEPFIIGSKHATASMDAIKQSSAKMVPEVNLAATAAGNSLSRHLEAAGKDGARSIADAVAIMKKDLGDFGDHAEQVGNQTGNAFHIPEPKAQKLTGTIGQLSAAMLITKGATTALSMAKGSLDSAFGRIDTLNNFENTMTRLTGSSEEAAEGMEGVRDAVVGTNYMLDSAAQTVQRLVMQNKDLEKSTESYKVWGDAVAFYGDGSADAMDNVMDAMIQMRATGTVNMAQMDRMVRRGVDPWEIYADAIGRSVGEVRDAMRDGEMGANEFFDAVEHAMREGGNELASVTGMAQQAGDTWKGSFANMATATARGTASIIESMDDAFSETRFGSMKENVQGFGKTFEGVLNGVAGVIPPVVSSIDTMVGGIIDLKESSVILAPAIIGVTTAIAGYMVIKKAELYTRGFIASIKTLTGAKTAAAAVTKAMTIAEKSHLSAAAQSKAMNAGSAATNLHTVAIKAKTIATAALKMATSGVGLAMGAAAAIGAFLFKSWNDNRKAAKELASEIDGLSDEFDGLNDASESNAKAFEAQGKVIDSNAERNKDLAAELERLTAIEGKSAAEKQLMADTVEELNNSVAGLNLAYDEESGLLNATTEEIQKRIEASKGMEEVNSLVERQNQLTQEAADYETTLKEVAKERAMFEYDAAVSGVDGKKAVQESLAELDAKEAEAMGNLEGIYAEKDRLADEEQAKRQETSEATVAANEMMIASYGSLNDFQKGVVDELNSQLDSFQKKNEDVFKDVPEKVEYGMGQARQHLKDHLTYQAEHADNMEKLWARAGDGMDTGLLEKMAEGTPEMRALAADMVNASEEEMSKLLEEYAKIGENAPKQFAKTHGLGEEDVRLASRELANVSVGTLRDELDKADLTSVGKKIPEETAEGMAEGEDQVAEAAENIAQVPGQVIEETIANTNYAEITDPLAKGASDGILAGIQPVGDASKELAETPEKLFGEVIDQDVFVAHGETPGKGYVEGIDRSKEAVQASAAELSGVPREVFEKEMDPETFKGFGVNIGEGAAGGIDQSAPQVENATKQMAELANKAFRKENDINSPSGVYRKYGGNITTGLAQGIEQDSSAPERAIVQLAKKLMSLLDKELNANQMGKQIGKPMVEGIAQGIDQNSSKVLSSIAKMTDEMVKKSKKAAEDVVKEFEKMDRDVDRTLQNMPRIAAATMRESNQAYREGMRDANDTIREGAQRMPDQMSHLPDQFYRIGQNSMIGLNNGLVAGQAQVLSTAATIANQVAQTMQRALDINSPSKVMEMDVGRWIPAGIGEGIERFKHFALDAIEDLGAQLVLPNIQAESVAIAGNAGFGLSLPAVKSGSTTTNQTIHNTPHIDIRFDEITINDNRDIAEISELLAEHTADEMRRRLE
jgi:tape measure domain-containing protein